MSANPHMAAPHRVCLITGSATGIGAACARLFAAQGWHVGISHFGDATLDEAQAVLADCTASGASAGAKAMLHSLDVRDDAACVAFAQAAMARWGRIDALINCAAVTNFIAHSNLSVLDGDEFHRTYDVNVVGAYQMARACFDALRLSGGQGGSAGAMGDAGAAGVAGGAGSIVNVSSIGGVLGRGSSMAYAASKGALNTLTLAMARSMAPQVRVNAIAPGFVDGGLPSRMLDEQHHQQAVQAQTQASVLRRVSQPHEVAALAWFLTTQAPGITGEVVMMDNGLHLNAG